MGTVLTASGYSSLINENLLTQFRHPFRTLRDAKEGREFSSISHHFFSVKS